MGVNPQWKAFVDKKRATERCSSESTQQANSTLHGGESGYFLAGILPINIAVSTGRLVNIEANPDMIRYNQLQ